jgi:hypothetical protein
MWKPTKPGRVYARAQQFLSKKRNGLAIPFHRVRYILSLDCMLGRLLDYSFYRVWQSLPYLYLYLYKTK